MSISMITGSIFETALESLSSSGEYLYFWGLGPYPKTQVLLGLLSGAAFIVCYLLFRSNKFSFIPLVALLFISIVSLFAATSYRPFIKEQVAKIVESFTKIEQGIFPNDGDIRIRIECKEYNGDFKISPRIQQTYRRFVEAV